MVHAIIIVRIVEEKEMVKKDAAIFENKIGGNKYYCQDCKMTEWDRQHNK